MTPRLRMAPQIGKKIPFWVKQCYDLSLPGDKADIARLMHRVIFRCQPNMRASHRTVLAFVFDRTVGWDKFYERITYDQFEDGVYDREGYLVAPGSNLSRKTISKCLDDLISWGLLLRRIETGCKEPNKYFYALNLGAGVGVKNRDGASFICRGLDYLKSVPNLFQPEKQIASSPNIVILETVFENGKMSYEAINSKGETTMLPIPKRLKNIQEKQVSDFDAFIASEFGEEASPTSVEKVNCPQCIEPLETGVGQCNDAPLIYTDRDTEPKNAEADAACAAVSGVEALKQVVNQTRLETKARHQAKAESTFSKQDAPIGELETLWKTTYSEALGKFPIPWTGRNRGQVKQLQRKWNASGRESFAKAMVWWIQRWEEIGILFFNNKDGEQEAKYPSEPVIGFLTACFDTYVRAYDKDTLVDAVPGMNDRDRFINRLRVRNWDEGKILHLADEKFPVKTKKPTREEWKEAVFKPLPKLQPVAKPLPVLGETHLGELPTLEEWK